jgi:hypothetical protein
MVPLKRFSLPVLLCLGLLFVVSCAPAWDRSDPYYGWDRNDPYYDRYSYYGPLTRFTTVTMATGIPVLSAKSGSEGSIGSANKKRSCARSGKESHDSANR